MMFAVVMIALNGLIGLSLLLGGWRHREQHYNLQGTSAYLNTIMALSVLGLVLPNYTTSLSGPRLTLMQEEFLIVTTLILYGVFLAMQTSRHRHHFIEMEAMEDGRSHGHDLALRATGFHTLMLFLFLATVIVLAEKLAIPLDNMVERFKMPQAFGGAIVAALVLAPEGLAGIKAARQNQLQRSVNILHGSVLATIGLTIPAVLTIGIITHREMRLGIEGGNLPLLVLTLGSSIVTFGSGRTSVLQGCIHLLLFGVFILLIFCP
jgi:Ca2+:H+ antiporter